MKKINEFKTEEDILELLDDELANQYRERIKEFKQIYGFMRNRIPVAAIPNTVFNAPDSEIAFDEIRKTYKESDLYKSYNNPQDLCIRALYLIYQYSNHQIPTDIPNNILNKFCFRDLFITVQGFSLVTEAWINPLVDILKGKKVVELFAGLGTITKSLKDRGIDIIATDTNEWTNSSHAFTANRKWCDIEELDAVNAIDKYKDADYFIISWCPYTSEASYDALVKMREVNPNARLIHIGEPYGGCTDSDIFFENVEYIDDKSFSEVISNFKSWDGIHDDIMICK